jgi:hypothetical protein
MATTKPTVFISHATNDRPIAGVLKTVLDTVFANGVSVFAASVPSGLRPGDDWFASIEHNLDVARAALVLVTPSSLLRPWIWFETGAFWARMRSGAGRMYPVCVREVHIGELPEPLCRLQAVSLGQPDGVARLLGDLCRLMDFGDPERVDAYAVVEAIPSCASLPRDERDHQGATVYAGPYERYSDPELVEVIQEEYLGPEYRRRRAHQTTYRGIFSGALMHYDRLDYRLKLPPGASKRLLKGAASRYSLEPTIEGENTVRFQRKRP